MPTPRIHESHAARTAAYRARIGKVKPVTTPYTALRPGYRRWEVMLEHVQGVLQTVIDERAEYYEERSEAWQESEKADSFTEKSETIQEALDLLEGIE